MGFSVSSREPTDILRHDRGVHKDMGFTGESVTYGTSRKAEGRLEGLERTQTEKVGRSPWEGRIRYFMFNTLKPLRRVFTLQDYKRKFNRNVLYFYLLF